MPVTFSAERIFAAVTARVEAVVNETAEAVAVDAQQRAPVRKVFRGSRGATRLQNIEEVAAEAHQRSQLGLAPGPVRTQASPAAAIHGFGPRRLLRSPGVLRFNTPLTSRGRYELRTGRANITIGNRSYLGGRLRSEIHAEPAEGGPTYVAHVVSPTPYSKYVEFGTRHNRAQPYLRPALAAQRSSYRERLARAVGAA